MYWKGNWVKDERAIKNSFKIEIGIYNRDTLPGSLVRWPYGALSERVQGIKNKKTIFRLNLMVCP